MDAYGEVIFIQRISDYIGSVALGGAIYFGRDPSELRVLMTQRHVNHFDFK